MGCAESLTAYTDNSLNPSVLPALTRVVGGDAAARRESQQLGDALLNKCSIESLTIAGGSGGSTLHFTVRHFRDGTKERKHLRVFRNKSVGDIALMVWNLFLTRDDAMGIGQPVYQRSERGPKPTTVEIERGDALELLRSEFNRAEYNVTLGRNALTVGEDQHLILGW